eukprot:scaffold18381_cov124-Isochrysis_galbana.AAC.1
MYVGPTDREQTGPHQTTYTPTARRHTPARGETSERDFEARGARRCRGERRRSGVEHRHMLARQRRCSQCTVLSVSGSGTEFEFNECVKSRTENWKTPWGVVVDSRSCDSIGGCCDAQRCLCCTHYPCK